MTARSQQKVQEETNLVFQYLYSIVTKIEENGDRVLTVLSKELTTATDNDIHHIVYYLLQQSVYPFLEMLGKWLYYGIVDDKFDEFMIAEARPSQRVEGATGLEKFILKESRVQVLVQPRFLTS